MLLEVSTAIPCGLLNCARTAGPPSPAYPIRPVPATSVSVPPDILNTAFDAVKYTFPLASSATLCGCVISVPNAAAGVSGTDPPATVVTRYCGWAAAMPAQTNARPSNLFNLEYKTLSQASIDARLFYFGTSEGLRATCCAVSQGCIFRATVGNRRNP